MAAQWRICRASWSGRNWERSRSCVIIHYYSPKTTLPPLPSPSFPLLFRFDSAISLRFFFASIPRNWNCVLQLSINFDYSFHNFIFSFENFERGTILEAKEETKNTPFPSVFLYTRVFFFFSIFFYPSRRIWIFKPDLREQGISVVSFFLSREEEESEIK